MDTENTDQSGVAPSAVRGRGVVDRQLLALDALSRLTRQFSDSPDLQRLLQVLLLTLSGQCSVTSAFAALRSGDETGDRIGYAATGGFRQRPELERLVDSVERWETFAVSREPARIVAPGGPHPVGDRTRALYAAGVRIVVPIYHHGELLGIVGLGEKANCQSFDATELDVLATLVNTVTPLLANSLVFLKMSRLSAWYLKILDSVQPGVFVFSSDHQLVKANAAGFAILKQFLPDTADVTFLCGAPLDEVFPEAWFPGWATKLQAVGETPCQNLRAQRDSLERTYNVRLSALKRSSGAEPDLVVVVDDVTGQRENQARLFELEKFAEKGVMASSIAHELNNFLALILGGVELAQMVLGMGSAERARTALEKLKGAADRMERFTAGLTDFSRLRARREEADLNGIIADVLSFVSIQRPFKWIRMESNLAPNLPPLHLDEDLVAQLLLNLLNNAAAAVQEAKREEGAISLSTRLDGNAVVLSIEDNGTGIAPEIRDKLFHTRLTTKDHGHGYGLVTCAHILHEHGGGYDFDTSVGKGTTFHLRFPTDPAPAPCTEVSEHQEA